MAKSRKSKSAANAGEVETYRYRTARRKNNPPAAMASAAPVPPIARAKYEYNPHLPPVLRFDQTGSADVLETRLSPAAEDRVRELLALTASRPLTVEEREELATLIAQAAHAHVAAEPWLEWTGKREKKWFEVDPVALHIHERISAQAILKVAAREDVQRGLFADPQQSYHEAVQFYKHDIDWANRLILGDSLSVMSSLAKREDLSGKVQMIYIDPPYGIKFASNFQPEIGRRDVKDKEQDLTREPEMVKAYRDTWNLGIHSYLSYLRDRLIVAKELLADSGSIFVQISDENLHRVRDLLDEVFGPEQFCGVITFRKTSGANSPMAIVNVVASVSDYVLWYARSVNALKYRQLYVERTPGGEGAAQYTWSESDTGAQRPSGGVDVPSSHRSLRPDTLSSTGFSERLSQAFSHSGANYAPPENSHWKTTPAGLSRLSSADRLIPIGKRLYYKRFFDDFGVFPLTNTWTDTGSSGFADPRVYVVQTVTRVIQRCLLMTTDPGDLVLDPTCGSGTTAYVAEQWGRRWITIDTSRVALSIARQRLLTAKFDYYKTRSSGVHAAVSSDFRGSGVLAASSAFRASESSGEDAASTFLFGAFDPEQPVGHIRGGNLPHWRQEGVTYFVTWRTADSMPKERVEQWTRERVQWLQQNPSPWTDAQRQDYARRFTARWERWLDECHGECLLREPKLKKLVEDALRHFDSQRYSLGEFVVMPNHVHVLVTPLAGHELSEIIGAWKSYTAHAINRELGRTGEFWQKESFDHIVRSAEAAERFGRYIRENPRRSGVLAAVSEGGKTQTSGGDAASTNGNPSKGFIYKTVPHITLKSIAQNVALDPIFVKHEPILEAKLKTANAALAKVSNDLRHKLEAKLLKKQREEGKKSITDADRRRWLLPPDNRVRSAEAKQRTTIDLDAKQWYAWEVPFDTDPDWPQALQDAVREYRQAWRAKMDEVNACIAASAEQEELVDQPEVVRGVTRVSGPFTVEAVQPPEMSLGDVIGGSDVPVALETFGSGGDAASTFTIRPVVGGVGQTPQDIEAYLDKMIRLLKLDGVRFPNNRQMTFSRLDPIYASGQGQGMFHAEGRWVNAGETDADPNSGATVGVVIGPQYGPVTAAMVDNLIKPASRRYDDLVVAAFSFDAEAVAILTEDPHLKLRLHMAHIRPDVNPAMEGLLKDSPGGQLFTVFGLPRINVSPPDADGMYRVTMEGVDIYDPVNNTIQSSGADKVAAWFLDSDYDGRTFCVTQAFFPDRSAWDKLARALGDAIDPERFEALSGTTSLPFAAGKHRRIAVKVIDPRGNEVMAVQAVGE